MIKKKYNINLPDEYIDRIVDSIITAVPTEAIYIFGSYARGDERPESDIDILRLLKKTAKMIS